MSQGETAKQHFDAIAETYKEEIPDHIREYLVQKWWGVVERYFHGRPCVIDIGCGDGTNMMFLKGMGISPVGIELSANMVRRGKERYPELEGSIFEGSALNVEFPDHAFDVAMMTGVLHHIYSRAEQMNAVREALRVVNRDGVVIIRESNLINPLFRIFWNYIFPLTAKIDRFGGEHWIPAKRLQEEFGLAVQDTIFFTFIPNFLPSAILPLAGRVEKALERSAFRKLAAHYIIVIRKA
ncbi:MAG: class I SAM-dependent methyltransferase [Nitrospira sp.]|nr:class I SAM-dependent methyltransferase [Nitrospira sp.]